mmetsp:Transcript_33027/g.78242  ORF Transcript_33027/g.78242 Transcript_33027/m.78242 type:complete len:299 (+) Transcript_33027:216-1112(+)
MSARAASHAGSWYSANKTELDRQLSKWLQDVTPSSHLLPSRAVIAPHAGYSYSGPTAAHAYRHLDPTRINRIFILGPSHHYHLTGCAISGHASCETPLGDLSVDRSANQELMSTGMFEVMSERVDSEEHSIEMHLPYIYKVMEGAPHPYTIVPVMVGNLSPEKERQYGVLFSKYMEDAGTFFVVSSDFCHWGNRFSFTHYDPAHGEIFQSIENLDKAGMEIIESQSPEAFLSYQQQYHNTICGRHPIAVLLNILKEGPPQNSRFNLQFVKYAQSSPCRTQQDSSVSYASAILSDKTLT